MHTATSPVFTRKYFCTFSFPVACLKDSAFLQGPDLPQTCSHQTHGASLGYRARFCGEESCSSCCTPLDKNAFLHVQLPQMGLFPPLWGSPGDVPGYVGVQGAHLPCCAPWAQRVPPDTLGQMRGSGNPGFSSVLEERETLWLQQQLLPPALSPSRAQNPNLAPPKALKTRWVSRCTGVEPPANC